MTQRLIDAMLALNHKRSVAELEIIVDRLGLGDWYQHFLFNNPAANLPYHNTIHSQYVALTAFRLFCADTNRPPEYRHNCFVADCRLLVLAGLFHDFDHSGGKLPDQHNVNRAINTIDSLAKEFGLGQLRQLCVSDMIRGTLFPPSPDHQYSELGKYLVDADFLWTSELAAIKVVMDGLPKEMAVRTGDEPATPIEMVDIQRNFLPSVTMKTDIAQSIWTKTKPLALDAQEAYAEAWAAINE